MHELKPFDRQVYEKGVWEIRDELVLMHFVPEFSPVAVHAWLLWATWNRDRYDDKTLAENAPWYTLNPKWLVPEVRPFLGFNIWFSGDYLQEWQEPEKMMSQPSIFNRSDAERAQAWKRLNDSLGTVIVLFVLFISAIVLSIFKLSRLLPRRPALGVRPS
jgi:hypothetical protein